MLFKNSCEFNPIPRYFTLSTLSIGWLSKKMLLVFNFLISQFDEYCFFHKKAKAATIQPFMNAFEVFIQFCNGISPINDHNTTIISLMSNFTFVTFFLANNQEGRLYKEGTTVARKSTPVPKQKCFFSMIPCSQLEHNGICKSSYSLIFTMLWLWFLTFLFFSWLTVTNALLKSRRAHVTCMFLFRWFLILSVVEIRASIRDNIFRNPNCLGVICFAVSRNSSSLVYIISFTILLNEGRTKKWR